MSKWRKKPVVIEATRWFKNGDHPNVRMLDTQHISASTGEPMAMLDWGWIDTLEGGHRVTPGDWIITGVKGEHYPCKPDIFDATYEAVT